MKNRAPFEDAIVTLFHNKYHGHDTGLNNPPWAYWRSHEIMKPPTDLWIYQELIYNEAPQVIIELGTCSGGSALFMADMLELCGDEDSVIVTVDWKQGSSRPSHPRIRYVEGDTRDPGTLHAVISQLEGCDGRQFLILDASHDYQQVKVELDLWVPFLRERDILIVEDTDLGGPDWGLQLFQEENTRKMEEITWCQKFMLTYNPRGYWRMLD